MLHTLLAQQTTQAETKHFIMNHLSHRVDRTDQRLSHLEQRVSGSDGETKRHIDALAASLEAQGMERTSFESALKARLDRLEQAQR